MTPIRVLVLRAAGINCDEETAFAWSMAGATPELVHINRLAESPAMLDRFQILTIPGGFSHGDAIASGRILGRQFAHDLGEPIARFVDRGGCILGVCNGFQVLVRAGLVPGPGCDVPVTLMVNDSARYEDRWVRVRAEKSNSIFFEPGEEFEYPVAHGEGKFAVADPTALAALEKGGHVALRYVGTGNGPVEFPENPNGSIGAVAGLTDRTGRVLGLMPHPERNLFTTSHPTWTSRDSIESDGPRLFRRAVRHFS